MTGYDNCDILGENEFLAIAGDEWVDYRFNIQHNSEVGEEDLIYYIQKDEKAGLGTERGRTFDMLEYVRMEE